MESDIFVIPAIWATVVCDSLRTLKHNVARASPDTDVPLKQRHDEFPEPLEPCDR